MNNQEQEQEQSINLAEYYHVITRHKWTIVLSLIFMVGLALYHNSHLIPIYRATCTMIIDKERTRSPLTGQRMDYETYMSESMTFNTHFKLITSRAVLERAVKELKLDQTDGGPKKRDLGEINPFRRYLSQFKKNIRLLLGRKKKTPPPQDRMTGLVMAVRGMVQIEPVEETRLLKINAAGPDPAMARDVANALAQGYIEFNVSNRLKSSQNTLSWLTDHLYKMKKKLEDAEEEFLAYKQKAKLISVQDSQKIVAQKITEFNDAYIQTRNRRLELEAKLGQLTQISKSGKEISHVRSLIANTLIESLYGHLLDAEGELSRLSKVYKSKHPKVVQLKAKINDTRKRLQKEIKKELDNLKAERGLLLAKENVLQKTIADFKKEGMATNKKELKYSIFKRNVQMNQRLYDTLLSRLKEVNITGNVDVSNIRITEKAILPRFPIGPNKKRNFILAVVFGLMIGIGLSFLKEYVDRSLHTEEDVQRYLGLPVLSAIPLAGQAEIKSSRAKHESRAMTKT